MKVRGGLATALLVAAACGTAPTPPAPAVADPRIGQPGKDVVWVPSPDRLVDAMLDLAAVDASDFLIDLGSGDGRTVLAAARRGARALGIEFNRDLVLLSRKRAEDARLTWRASFEQGDIFASDFSRATVITLFLSSGINLRLRPQLLALAPGTRVVTNTFDMADWEPDRRAQVGDCASWCDAMLWIVPARVAGTWKLGGEVLRVDQSFQRVRGSLGATPIEGGRLHGPSITFTAEPRTYQGRVTGSTMTGVTDTGVAWSASR